jgi:porin
VRAAILLFLGLAGLAALPASAQVMWWPELQDGYRPVPSVSTSLPNDGDPGGARKWLGERGVAVALEYTSDVLSNVQGGTRTGTIYQGKFQGILMLDLGRMAGLEGLTFFANFFQIHNTGRMRRDYVGGINTIAAIEAVPTTRLSEVWLEQVFAEGKVGLKVGQIAADSEFFFSDLSGMFLQSDWPTIAATNLPSGGAAYPLSTPGARLKMAPMQDVTLMLAVLNGDPAGPPVPGGPADEQLRNPHGLNFRFGDAPFLIGEIQIRRNAAKTDSGLSTTLKLGTWGHLGGFEDMRYTAGGGLIADPASSGNPARVNGNIGFYAVLDQQLYRPAGGDAQSGISVYSRASLSPPDRNLVDRYIDGGIVFAGMIPQRPDDKFGAAVMHARFSDAVRAHDWDFARFNGPTVIRDHETNLELTYVAQVVPGWTLQPVLQFVWHPNGDASRNAVVVGLRSLLRY